MLGFNKLNLTQNLMILAACGNAALATGFFVNTAPATAQTASSYPFSCTDIEIEGDELSARCLRANLNPRSTDISIRGIENRDGQLVSIGTQPNQPSTYQNSCRNEQIYGATLVAVCTRINGSEQRTSIVLPGISNNNGRLSY